MVIVTVVVAVVVVVASVVIVIVVVAVVVVVMNFIKAPLLRLQKSSTANSTSLHLTRTQAGSCSFLFLLVAVSFV